MARIALVDDDPEVRALLERVLTSAGYRPEVFESGDAFVRSKAAGSFDVVVSDFQMVGVDRARAAEAKDGRPES